MKRNIKGAAQVKFDTTAHDYGKRAVTMTPKERTNYREGLKHALSFAPITPVVGLIAKLAAKIMAKAPKIAKADKSVPKPPTPTTIFRETGKHTTKQFEHPMVSGYSKTTGKWMDI